MTGQQTHMTLLASLKTVSMVSLWNFFLLLPLSLPLSLHSQVLTGENVKETKQRDTAEHFLTPTFRKTHAYGLAPGNSVLGAENVQFLNQPFGLSTSSYESMDRQGVIGEYSDLQDSTEITLSYHNERRVISRPTQSATEDATPTERVQTITLTQGQTFNYQSTEKSTVSVLHSTQSRENEPLLTTLQNEMTDSNLPIILSDSLPSHKSDQNSTSLLPTGPEANHEDPTPSTGTEKWGWTRGISGSTKRNQDDLTDVNDHNLHIGGVSTEAAAGKNHILS